MKKTIPTALTVLLFLAVSSLPAQEASSRPMREELIKLNYVTDPQMISILRTYLSPDGRLNWSAGQHYIALKDYPQNVEKVLSFIKKIDVRPADLAFTVHLILASATDDIKTDESLAGDPLIKELRSFLRYKNYSLLDTTLVRALDKQRSRVTLGTKDTEFVLELQPIFVLEEEDEFLRVTIELVQRMVLIKGEGGAEKVLQKTLIESNLSLKPGEKTVVGVSKMDGGDKGLILIISGKIVK